MYWLIFRIFIYVLLGTSIWYGGQFYSARKTLSLITAPPTAAIFVDQNVPAKSHPATMYFDHYDKITHKLLSISHTPDLSTIHTGTELFPFQTITEAVTLAEKTEISVIFIAHGTYTESLILPNNISLIGNNDVRITYDPLSFTDVIQTGDHTKLVNLHISGGRNAIMIPYHTSATISNVIASEADDYGVLMGKSDRASLTEADESNPPYEYLTLLDEDIDSLPHIIFRNITITHNKNQGMYLRDGRVTITDAHIIENGEEGIDLHAHMIAKITKTESLRNGESGLETEIYDNIIHITDSIFDGNVKNGIGFNTSYGIGDMIIERSTITNNMQYGIRCARHTISPDEPRPFFQSMITQDQNIIQKNAGGNISSPCYLF